MPMIAKLVHDYSGDPILPDRLLPVCKDPDPDPELGADAFDAWQVIADKKQFIGTPAEKLSETAGRSCYHSFGTGRNSEDYHKHILEVNHGSVYEHYNYTVEVTLDSGQYTSDLAGVFAVLLNRPGIWVELGEDTGETISVRITLNMRSTVEWHRWSTHAGFTTDSLKGIAKGMGGGIRAIGNQLAPNIVVLTEDDDEEVAGSHFDMKQVKPLTMEEKWISLLVGGSRGFSHELVRHGDRTAISQRSTRYVDEDGSEYVVHPLLDAFRESRDATVLTDVRDAIDEVYKRTDRSVTADQETYRAIVEGMQPWLVSQGAKKFDARKQARGAARGFLGNALYTEMIFSASLAQWHRIFRQRTGMAADAEIREIGCQALREIKASQYGADFENWTLEEGDLGWFGVENSPANA